MTTTVGLRGLVAEEVFLRPGLALLSPRHIEPVIRVEEDKLRGVQVNPCRFEEGLPRIGGVLQLVVEEQAAGNKALTSISLRRRIPGSPATRFSRSNTSGS